jgi:hypothetical protein
MNRNTPERRKRRTALERIEAHLGSYNPLDDDEVLNRIRRRVFGSLPEDKDKSGPGKASEAAKELQTKNSK